MWKLQPEVFSLEGEKYQCDIGWVEQEFSGISLGDARRDRRLKQVAETLSLQPSSSISVAHEDWSGTKAAYRLFSNESIDYKEIIKPHLKNTRKRSAGEKVLLSIQDTTVLSYQGHNKCEGLAIINKTGKGVSKVEGRGILMHSALMVTESGLPLGLGALSLYTREEPSMEREHQKLPITEKESFRWIETLQSVKSLFSRKDVEVIHVGDRENDIYEFIQIAREFEEKFIVRSGYDRLLEEGDKLRASVLSELCCGEMEVSIPARSGNKAQRFTFEIYFKEVTLKPARRRGGSKWIELAPQTVTAVIARDISKKKEATEWLLLTNTKVSNYEEAVKCIKRYQQRWQIEIFHKVLKSGCQVEDCRLESVARLSNYIALNCVIAWRIYWCTYLNRVHAKADATMAMSSSEIKVLELMQRHEQSKEAKIKTVRDAIRALARIGGFLARRGDGQPGPTYLWRGFQKLGAYLELYEAMRNDEELQNCG